MGGAKRELEEHLDRGWSAPEKFVCAACVDDEYLKDIIRSNSCASRCSYCGTQTSHLSAASVELIMPVVASALNYSYAEPTEAGVPHDKEFLVESIGTVAALMDLPFDCNDGLLHDVAGSFSNMAWIPATGGDWASSSPHEEWTWSWKSFVSNVKHRSRYFFMASRDGAGDDFRHGPLNALERVGEAVSQLNLLTTLPSGSDLYRARERAGQADWPANEEQLGAPPKLVAKAGRMNPPGISYLYLSTTQSGALAEVLRGPPCRAVVATFRIADSLNVLDLTRLPALPSVFDESQREVREAVLFLDEFVRDICQPVEKDGREHINYVPSQVVSEYFAQVFKTSGGKCLDGIIYPSAISARGVNVTLFPRTDTRPFAHAVRLEKSIDLSIRTWTEFSKAIL